MKNVVSIIFLLITTICSGQVKYDEQKISTKTKIIVKAISKENRLTNEYIGEAGTKSKQFDNFEKLKKASTEELLNLTNHPNGIVRCYSFWALGFRTNIDLLEIVKNHLNDNEEIEYQSGCIVSNEKVGDFFISLVTPNYVDLDVKKLNESQRKNLDSLLIYNSNELNARFEAIETARETPQLYSVLRNLYLKTSNQSALVKLSKYKREEDISLILANRENDDNKESGYFHTYRAIQNFPKDDFIPFLEARLKETLDETHFSTEWRELYSAIVMYKNLKALELLNVPFSQVENENIRKYHFDFIYDAILENFDNIYAEILWKIWEKDNEISIKGYRFYLQNNINRGYEMTINELLGVKNKITITPIYNESVFAETLEESMLNLVIMNDKELANQIIDYKILNVNVHEFPIYTSLIKKDKDNKFVESLFKRFEKEWNPHVYLEIAKTLIEFNDKTINDKIIEIRKVNKKLTEDWGGKALTELLKENNIN